MAMVRIQASPTNVCRRLTAKKSFVSQGRQRSRFSSSLNPDGEDYCSRSNEARNTKEYFLAHMNVARLKAPIDDPCMSEFKLAMEPVNALSRATPGFVWSLDDANLDYIYQREEVPVLNEDPFLMPQMSLWTDIESIQHFAFKSGHAIYLKRKREWFVPIDSPYTVCWWRPAEMDCPSLKEAFDKLNILKLDGPSLDAFDFKTAKDVLPKDIDFRTATTS